MSSSKDFVKNIMLNVTRHILNPIMTFWDSAVLDTAAWFSAVLELRVVLFPSEEYMTHRSIFRATSLRPVKPFLSINYRPRAVLVAACADRFCVESDEWWPPRRGQRPQIHNTEQQLPIQSCLAVEPLAPSPKQSPTWEQLWA